VAEDPSEDCCLREIRRRTESRRIRKGARAMSGEVNYQRYLASRECRRERCYERPQTVIDLYGGPLAEEAGCESITAGFPVEETIRSFVGDGYLIHIVDERAYWYSIRQLDKDALTGRATFIGESDLHPRVESVAARGE